MRFASKLMRNEDQWQREIDVRENCNSDELLGTRNQTASSIRDAAETVS